MSVSKNFPTYFETTIQCFSVINFTPPHVLSYVPYNRETTIQYFSVINFTPPHVNFPLDGRGFVCPSSRTLFVCLYLCEHFVSVR